MTFNEGPNFPQNPPPGHQSVGLPPQKKGMSTGVKILLGFVALFTLGFAGCVGAVAVSAIGARGDLDAATESTTDDRNSLTENGTEEVASDGDKGSVEDPHQFGIPHTREPGLLGAGWTVSIDEVRTIGDSELFEAETDGTCLAVIGTATLDSLEGSDELTSNFLSFPEIKMVAEGKELEPEVLSCDEEPLDSEGLTWALDMELTPGTTIQWYEVFRPTTDGSYDFVAIENDVYAK